LGFLILEVALSFQVFSPERQFSWGERGCVGKHTFPIVRPLFGKEHLVLPLFQDAG
jgi:hypothetical protein